MVSLADCQECGKGIYWISSPTGGWWKHLVHPADDHDGEALAPIDEEDWV